MLTELVIENVKAFGPRQVVPLAPITLILGPNSAGKSSLIQSIALMKQSLVFQNNETQLRLIGELVDLGSYTGFVHRHDSSQLISLGLTVRDSYRNSEALSLTITFGKDSTGSINTKGIKCRKSTGAEFVATRNENLQSLQVSTDEIPNFVNFLSSNSMDRFGNRWGSGRVLREELDEMLNSLRRTNNSIHLNSRFPYRFQGIGDGTNEPDFRFEQDGDEFEIELKSSGTDREFELISRLAQKLWFDEAQRWKIGLRSVRYVGPQRQLPNRISTATSERVRETGISGENVVDLLSQRRNLIPKVNTWFQKLEIPYSIDVVPIHYEGLVSAIGEMHCLVLHDNRSGAVVSMRDVGYGISQILPVIVESVSSNKSTLLIEQPELHLHPALQAKLGNLFAEQSRTNQFIIETHSEHLVLRLKRLIRRGNLRASDVSLISVNSDLKGASYVSQIRLDGDGEFIDEWPRGFFDERLDEIFGD